MDDPLGMKVSTSPCAHLKACVRVDASVQQELDLLRIPTLTGRAQAALRYPRRTFCGLLLQREGRIGVAGHVNTRHYNG